VWPRKSATILGSRATRIKLKEERRKFHSGRPPKGEGSRIYRHRNTKKKLPKKGTAPQKCRNGTEERPSDERFLPRHERREKSPEKPTERNNMNTPSKIEKGVSEKKKKKRHNTREKVTFPRQLQGRVRNRPARNRSKGM